MSILLDHSRQPRGGSTEKSYISSCAGWFGEIGDDFEKVIKILAREAASGDNGLAISPLVNADRKYRALPITMQQFRRAIGIARVRGQAKHQLGQLHYVWANALEAAAVCKRHHSEYR